MITTEEFRQKMSEFGISQGKMAREMGIDKSHFSKWVLGKLKMTKGSEFMIRSYFQSRALYVANFKKNQQNKPKNND
jgi:plasmid maintenance system antidote protein VapI